MNLNLLSIEQLTTKVPLNFGVMHMGAPCCGMNAAVRSFVRSCILLGHRPIGIQVNRAFVLALQAMV